MGKYARRMRCLTKEEGKSPCWEFTLLGSTDTWGCLGTRAPQGRAIRCLQSPEERGLWREERPAGFCLGGVPSDGV